MKTLAVLGAGGHGKVVADAAEACGRWDEIVFFDQAWPGQALCGPWVIVGDEAALLSQASRFSGVVVAIGTNPVRLDCARRLIAAGAELTTVIHPAATISRHASMAAGTVAFAGAVVNPGARIGMACVINTGASVDHDCVLGDGVHISPGAHLAGNVQVGEASWVGIGASVRQGITLGPNTMVGAGAAVVHSSTGGITLVGVPARPLERKSTC
jgi:sugar O-acyltransferase (sialic acid O-acetyltransferase NeuD family)